MIYSHKLYVRVERHVYPRTIVSMRLHCANPTKLVGLVQSGHHLNKITLTLCIKSYSTDRLHCAYLRFSVLFFSEALISKSPVAQWVR